MKLLYWDIENLRYLYGEDHYRQTQFDLVQCAHARPFEDIESRLPHKYKELKDYHLDARGPDIADIHLLALLNEDCLTHGRDNHFYLASMDKLLTYRFIVLARNLGIERHRIHTLYSDIEVRRRSKKGRTLFENGDLDKIPDELKMD